MTAIQPINEWFGAEKKAREKARSREELRAQKQRDKEAEVEYVDGPTIDQDEEWFRHHNWAEKRSKVRQALVDADASQNAITSFDNCGSDCQVEWSDELQRYRVIACYCHNRHCEPCMKGKSGLVIANLREKLKGIKPASHHFITLTLKHDTTTDLRSQIKRLYACYKKLRCTDEWMYGQVNADRIAAAMAKKVKHSEAVKHVSVKGQIGGAATLEIKWSDAGGWHPHLHIISEGSLLTAHRIKDLWYAITGDSWEADCRVLSTEKDVAFYVGKYLSKGTNNEVWSDPQRAAAYVKAVKGVRMLATFGSWRGYRLLQREKEKQGQWKHVASLASLVRRMQSGEEHARILLIALTDQCQYNPNRKRPPKRE